MPTVPADSILLPAVQSPRQKAHASRDRLQISRKLAVGRLNRCVRYSSALRLLCRAGKVDIIASTVPMNNVCRAP